MTARRATIIKLTLNLRRKVSKGTLRKNSSQRTINAPRRKRNKKKRRSSFSGNSMFTKQKKTLLQLKDAPVLAKFATNPPKLHSVTKLLKKTLETF
jgi:hypothetical protein